MAKKVAKKSAAKKPATKKAAAPKKSAAKKPAAKKSAAKKPAVAATKESLIVASKVKAYIKSTGKMTASETLEALNQKIYAMLDAAVARTESNRRSTVKPQDL